MNTETMGLENEDQCQCMYTWEFFAFIFFGIRKIPDREISTSQTPAWEISTCNIPTRVFKYSRPSFKIFSSLLLPLSLILIKRLFCNCMFQKCWSFYVCENLSKRSVEWRTAINEMGSNNPGENFLGANFPWESFLGGNFSGRNSSRGWNFHRTIFFI